MFNEVQPRSVDVSAVRKSYVDGPTPIRLVQPARADVDLLHWVAAHRDDVLADLAANGAVLFRDFHVDTIDGLRRFARTFTPDLIPYTERRSPRTELGDHIYTSTIHPQDQYIHFHNTTSFSHQWPRKLWFSCIQPAEWEGRTPIADCRKVLAVMDPDVAAEFKAKGVLYVSNYHDGIGLSWQSTFQTEDKAEVAAYCRRQNIEFEWLDGGERLRTKSRRHAVAIHPDTGEQVWFNQAHHYHVSSLEEEVTKVLLDTFAEEDLPRHAYFGDGTPIDQETLRHVYDCYEQNSNSFLWERGDVILLDNMLVAHSRTPYRGERLIALAIAEMYVPTYTGGGIAEVGGRTSSVEMETETV
ncbi:TauD/TfdA family dioxygenase [Actinophytocola sp. KF-1]